MAGALIAFFSPSTLVYWCVFVPNKSDTVAEKSEIQNQEKAMEESSNPTRDIIPYQNNSQYGILSRRCGGAGGRNSSSRFKGVLPLDKSKWGARISINYKAYWLGTFRTEDEAAVAYDRAALKLHKTEPPINLPWKFCMTQEKLFQSWYSDDEVLAMIKDKTYSSYFTCFLAQQSLARKAISESLTKAKDISYQMLFHKELSQTDVNNIEGFRIPKERALKHFPPLGNNTSDGGEMASAWIDLTFYDKYFSPCTFRYTYLGSDGTFLFTKGWKHFVMVNNLKPGDTVFFYACEHVDQAGQRKKFYLIDNHRNVKNPVDQAGQRVAEQGSGANVDGNTGVEKSNGVMLFGVRIG